MPKDEFDFADPLELNGAVFPTGEDTTGTMCECFIEEFMRMGYGPEEILALFRNPHYLGLHMVMQNRGEEFVREVITETFARWGHGVTRPISCDSRSHEAPALSPAAGSASEQSGLT